ncbi:MAG: hypothetical protein ABEK59_01260 [Halobacteria archaeon]
MSEQTYATVRGTAENLKQMIQQSSLAGDTEHGDLYLNILEDEIRVLQRTPGDSVLTSCVFTESFFDDISLEREVQTRTGDYKGDDYEYETGAEAILDVEQTQTYLDFASDGGTVELTFTGSDEKRLATYARAEGSLEAWVKLPGSREALSEVPHWLAYRWTDDNKFVSSDGESTMPVEINTKAEKLHTIIDAVKDDQDADYYPIVVRDGEFIIDVGDEQRSGVRGTLGAKNVEGPDVENYYYDGFEEILNILSGPITLQTAPNNAPLVVTQEQNGKIIRHNNGSVNQG